jgi:glutaredoxin-like protein NrdH
MNVPIKVYGKPDCSQCHMTTHHLDKLGLPYEYLDVTQDDDARDAVTLLGYRVLPVVVAGDMHWGSFRYDKLKQLASIHREAADVTELDGAAERYLADGAA